MRILSVGGMWLIALALGASVCVAEEKKADRKDCLRAAAAERMSDLNLTEAQGAKIAEIRRDFRPKVLGAAKDLGDTVREEVLKIREVLTPEQDDLLQTLREERKFFRAESLAERMANLEDLDLTEAEITQIEAIRQDSCPKIVQAMKELHGLLTEDQRKARDEALHAGLRRGEVRRAFKLSEEQQAKVETVTKQVGSLVRDELGKIHAVLSKGQQEQLAEMRAERREQVRDQFAFVAATLKELNLSDDQKAKVQEIRQEYRPKIQEAGNHLRTTVRDELSAILTVIKS